MAFAAWYAAMGSAINWPESVTCIQKSERAKRLSLERMLKLLSQVNYTFSGRVSAGHARLVLEGYAIHEWVNRNREEFAAMAKETYDEISPTMDAVGPSLETLSPFAARVGELGRIIKLSPLERDILSFSFLTTISKELSAIFEQLADDRWSARVLWTVLFDTSAEELAEAMRPRSPLRLSGLLQTTGRRAELARVPAFWVEVLAGSDSLIDALLEPLQDEIGSGRPARLLEEDLVLAVSLLKNASEPGFSLLLCGDASLDKRQLLQEIVAGSARTPWRMRRFDDAPREVLPSLTFVAFQLLAAKGSPAVLVVERPSEVLQTARSDFFQSIFGIELNLPLVSKSASTLLSKWLGDSEKNIAAAFEEAAAEDAILFFDEGDSFLRSRERAQHSSEVTQTNELLQRMERFEGIVIVATNLFRDLDAAALRRFTFKIEFRELDASQRWRMFIAEAGLGEIAAGIDVETRDKRENRLLLMPHLTPGDFATVKRQCLVLDTCLTPGEWLDQLEIECQIKSGLPRIEPSHRAA
jgi:hypothetical protein